MSDGPGNGAADDVREPGSLPADPPTLDLGMGVPDPQLDPQPDPADEEPTAETEPAAVAVDAHRTSFEGAPSETAHNAAMAAGGIANGYFPQDQPAGASAGRGAFNALLDRPEVAVGAAFACGLLLRALIRRRKRS